MSRKRFVTSDISIDEKIAQVAEKNPAAALMWPWFCTALDDWARMSANPLEVKLNVFQAFTFTAQEIHEAMKAYERAGLVHLYTVNGKLYLQVNPATFYRLNTYIQKARQQHDSSKFPPAADHPWGRYWATSDWLENGRRKVARRTDEQQETATGANAQQPTPNCATKLQAAATGAPSPSLSPSPSPSLSPTPSPDGEGIENSLRASSEDQGKTRQSARRQRPSTTADQQYSADFESFWGFYPRRLSKKAAWAKWQAQLRKGASESELILAAKHYAMACEGREDRYIMHPETFLGPHDRWRDHLSPPNVQARLAQDGRPLPRAFAGLQAEYERLMREEESGNDTS